jgi:virginiamycin B lyase
MSRRTLGLRLTVPARTGSVLAAAALLLGAPAAGAAAAAPGKASHLRVHGFTGAVSPQGMTAGPGGTVWFVTEGGQAIVRVNANGQMKAFTGKGICDPGAIAEGPDKALWFANSCDVGSIGRITASGTVTTFTRPRRIRDPGAITPGLQGALWFTNGTHTVGEITTSGAVIISRGKGVARPLGIVQGKFGTMWFTDYRDNMMSEGSIR